ncbi:MAG: type VII toxin-antitoxin system MntA family adenylyltransferase antitoxin [Candidatus Methanodesulfokora sp.]
MGAMSARLQEVLALIKDKVERADKKLSIEYALLFGSYAKEEQREYSDLDIAVKFKSDNNCIMKAGKLSQELSDVLGIDVNVVPINIADTILKYEIYVNGITIFCKNIEKYYDDRLNAIDEYLDFKELFKRHYKRVLERIKGFKNAISRS